MQFKIENSKLKILLFDIDGTLMLSGGAGRRAIDRTFLELFGIEDAFGDVVPDGNTDPLIFSEIINRSGLDPGILESRSAEIEDLYVRTMEEEMAASPGAHQMPGARSLLERLDARDDLHLGLLTGNLARTARIKLDRFSFNRFFDFGAFGSDDPDRNRLVPIAVRRAEEHLGRRLGLGPHVIVIGDTPKDVECALAAGATAVGVAASRYSRAELEAAGAHLTLATLEDSAAFIEAIGP